MHKNLKIFIIIIVIITGNLIKASFADIDSDELFDLVGYTILDCTSYPDEFEGADYDNVIKLNNGMVFEFTKYNYTYTYYPSVVVLAKHIKYEGKEIYLWKLIIEDEIYDVFGIK